MADIKISLSAMRVNANLSQDEVCKEMHISKNTLCSWENGKLSPRIEQVKELCKICGNFPIENLIL